MPGTRGAMIDKRAIHSTFLAFRPTGKMILRKILIIIAVISAKERHFSQ
jgi:hypothetical protein